MKCFICNDKVIWGNDFDAEDAYPDSEFLIMSNYSCIKCNAEYEVMHGKKKETNEQ